MNRRIPQPLSGRSASDTWPKLAAQCQYRVDELARYFGVTLRQVERLIKRDFNMTPEDWLREERMTAAHAMLPAAESVKSVALSLGYKQPSHFSRHFKARFQMTPTKFVLLQWSNAGGSSPTDQDEGQRAGENA